MINFIPNDPLSVADAPMRRVAARPDRPRGRAGIAVAGDTPEALYAPGTAGFVQWQARQAAILAVETWEEVLGAPMASWARESVDPKTLTVLPDEDEDMNAYYNRRSVSFFHKFRDGDTAFSGASTDVVSHEVGHAILDAIRPDLWASMQLEIGGFHESFGDVTALVTALSDRKIREELLAVSPRLDTANFVEALAEDLSDTVRRVLGRSHPASAPRHALNAFRWQLPETMPTTGGPDKMIAEVHSISRIMTGCFYDLVRAIFASSKRHTQAQLWSATRTAARVFYDAAQNAPRVPRFFRSVGRTMVLSDQNLNAGANRQFISDAFARHGLILGAQGFLAPELALAGPSPSIDRRRRAVTVQPNTLRDLRDRIGAPSRRRPNVAFAVLGDTPVAKVAFPDEVALDDVDPRLHGVVAPADAEALVGESGGAAALLFAPRAGAPTSEVLGFVKSLVANDQVAFGATSRRGAVAGGGQNSSATHAIRRRGSKQELQRIRFACNLITQSEGERSTDRAH